METSLELLHRGERPEASEPLDGEPLYSGPPRLLDAALPPERLRRVKFAYTTRHVHHDAIGGLLTGQLRPRAGDLVLARVDELGQHKRIELGEGRRSFLFPGDEIVVCYGNRYAPDQFEAEVPHDLSPCHLVAAGGGGGRGGRRPASISTATSITPLGLLADRDGIPLNLDQFTLGPAELDLE